MHGVVVNIKKELVLLVVHLSLVNLLNGQDIIQRTVDGLVLAEVESLQAVI
jgi:hypothetical protein